MKLGVVLKDKLIVERNYIFTEPTPLYFLLN